MHCQIDNEEGGLGVTWLYSKLNHQEEKHKEFSKSFVIEEKSTACADKNSSIKS